MRILLTALLAATPAAVSDVAKEPICFVSRARPAAEKTVTVPSPAVKRLLRTTLSYRGPCAVYGRAVPLGGGALRGYTQTDGRRPVAMGVTFTPAALRGLPPEMNDGEICFDKNGDGRVERDTECAVGHSRVLTLPKAPAPFRWALVNWNPMGHIPVGVYNVPHFDFHFYIQPLAARNAIRPGPCPILTNCDDYRRAKVPVPARYSHPDFHDVDAVEPGMGNHLVDTAAHEFHGKPFTHTWIYGAYDGKITFYETMITKAWFDARKDGCVPIKRPSAWAEAGWYPTRYCIAHRGNRGDYTVSLTSFVRRSAT
ncbi:hypothetical protein [Nonomuraea typhae]|uniref:hypothetical protein n=1 Tax=Nonomuraea typhae TaxID=2603600 RepID=UPI0012F87B48|nr:hypothetical protein [Nonomuraea typhae]